MGEVFGEIYGHHYSKQSISRMASATKDELLGWLERPLDAYYPIVDVDCTFVPVRRDGSVSKEAFYTSPLDPERCHQSMSSRPPHSIGYEQVNRVINKGVKL